jgi:nucleotide-binding universal stress UspA family protein
MSLKCDRGDWNIKNILWINHFHKDDGNRYDLLIDLAKQTKATLHLLEISPPGPSTEVVETSSTSPDLKNQAAPDFIIGHGISDLPLVFHTYQDNDAEHGVLQFLHSHEIDVIAIGVHSHSRPVAFLKGGLPRALLNHFHLPILTFPLKN